MPTSIQNYKNELLGGDLFLQKFDPQLDELFQNSDFMQLVDDIYSQVQEADEDLATEKNIAKTALFNQGAYFEFPAYKYIVDTVKDQGYAQNSAAISVYSVMRMRQEEAEFDSNDCLSSTFSHSSDYKDQISSSDIDAERWNEICFLVNRYRTPNATERDFQIEAENIFEKLGWARYKDEIVSQLTIPVGSAHKVRPDIIIRDNGTDVMVVELKRPNAGISSRNVDQLFSYMRLLKLDYGLLIGDTIQLYYDDPSDGEPPIQVVEIPFNPNSSDGIEFCNVIYRDGFSEQKLKDFAASLTKRASIDEQSDILYKLISSSEGADLIRQALFQFLCERYSPEVVNKVLDRMDIAKGDSKGEYSTEGASAAEDFPPPKENELYLALEEDCIKDMKVGEIANKILRKMLEDGAASAEEIRQMQDAGYSKSVFDLNYPLLVIPSKPYDNRRYYSNPLIVRGEKFKLCSQWFEHPNNNDRPNLVHWIKEHQKN